MTIKGYIGLRRIMSGNLGLYSNRRIEYRQEHNCNSKSNRNCTSVVIVLVIVIAKINRRVEYLRWTSIPVIVTVSENGDYIRAFLYIIYPQRILGGPPKEYRKQANSHRASNLIHHGQEDPGIWRVLGSGIRV